MRNFVLRYGVLGGCISIALGLINWFFVAQTFGSYPSQVVGYLSIIVALMCVPLGIKYFRDKLNKGAVSFREGFGIGTGITLINAIINFFYSATFFVVEGENFREWQEQAMTPFPRRKALSSRSRSRISTWWRRRSHRKKSTYRQLLR